jgi:hypothetical protein
MISGSWTAPRMARGMGYADAFQYEVGRKLYRGKNVKQEVLLITGQAVVLSVDFPNYQEGEAFAGRFDSNALAGPTPPDAEGMSAVPAKDPAARSVEEKAFRLPACVFRGWSGFVNE